jgi:hypothetical protein
MQNKVIKLTDTDGNPILIGVESIIQVYATEIGGISKPKVLCTKIESRGAMVSSAWVVESVEYIWEMINNEK